METQIRLAERQGLLRGYKLSRVQFYALSVVELLDRIKEIDEHDRQLRLSLITAHIVELEDAFPEFATVVDDDTAEFADEEESVTYDLSQANFDPATVEAEIAEMLARAREAETNGISPDYSGEWI